MTGTGIFFLLQSIFFIILLATVFYRKDRIKSYETNIYSKMIYVSVAELLLELLLDIATPYYESLGIILQVLGRAYCILILIWISLLSYYVAVNTMLMLDKKDFIPKMNKIYIAVTALLSFAVLIFDMNFFYEGNVYYSYGNAVKVDYVASFIHCMLVIVYMILNKKNIKNGKFLPVFIFLILGNVCGFIQMNNPQLLLSTAVHIFITFVMYFTIENPDIKMLNELYRNRELMEQGYEDKYNFLFEMTQDAKKPLLDLSRVCTELRNEDDPNKIKDGVAVVSNIVRQLDFSINNVLNVSSFDIQKIKIVDTKYDILKICEGLAANVRNEVKDNVTFNAEVPKNAPTLYGDYMKLRQILYSLLNNACKNTNDGSITFKLNIIEKYDFCRLIFDISDTGPGMSIDKINDILSATGELDKNEIELLEKKEFNFKVCQKVVKIMGGNLMIKSTVGKGTDITLTVDQRVYHEREQENSILNQYESVISMNKRVLIVAQNEDLVIYIKKKLNTNNITYSSLAFGGDAVDRLKAGKKYDYIIVEDEMKEMSGMATLQEFKKLNNFNIPVIVVLNKDKDKFKHHYVEDGFTDYVLADNLEDELIRIINKY